MNRTFRPACGALVVPALLVTGVLLAAERSAPASFPAHGRIVALSSGDAVRGRQAFIDLRCHACHRVAEDETLPAFAGAWEGPVLHDLRNDPAEVVGWKILTRSRLTPEAEFESPMAECASAMSEQQLADVIAYLRDPVAGKPERR